VLSYRKIVYAPKARRRPMHRRRFLDNCDPLALAVLIFSVSAVLLVFTIS